MIRIQLPQAELDRLRRNMTRNAAEVGREIGREVNQRALNIAGRTFDNIKPSSGPGVERERHRVRLYLGQQLSTAIKIAKRGIRKGRFMRRRGRGRQLIRANLIVQARRAKEGKKGLYGKGMAAETGKFRRKASTSVGFLKSPLLPIIRTLNGICRFKFPFSKTKNIARWPNSAGWGWARVLPSKNMQAVEMEFSANVEENSGKVQAMYGEAALNAILAENADIERHLLDRANKRAAKMNAER